MRAIELGLSESTLNEADTERTIMLSPADVYQMSGQTPPQIEGPGERLIQPPGWYDKVEMTVGPNGDVSPEFAEAHDRWVEGGRLDGLLFDQETGELKPYNENNILQDLAWQIAAGAVETASAVTKAGAKAVDDLFALIDPNTEVGDNRLLRKTMATSEIDPKTGKRVYDEFVLDKWQSWLEKNTDQAFRDNMDATAGAVESFSDVGGLFFGGLPGGVEGALGIMAGELPSEILDIGLMVAGSALGSPGAGLAVSGLLNALEAGGAATSEIQKRIDVAFDKGLLQQTPQYQMMFDAATQQLNEDGFTGTDEELDNAAANLTRDQLTHASINRAFYAVASVGGVIDTIQNKVLYSGPIRPGFIKNSLSKAVIGPATESVSEAAEQVLQNLAIMNKAGKITTPTAGAGNAAWNGWIAGHTATIVGSTADAIGGGNRAQKAARARIRRFVMGGKTDVKSLIDIMGMDPNSLINDVTDADGNLRLANMVRERGLKTTADVDTETLSRMNSTLGFYRQDDVEIDGTRYTLADLKQNEESLELLDLLSTVDIDPNENVAVIKFKNEEEIRRTAQLLGLESEGTLNSVMANLEQVRKLDVRIAGRSNLEAPLWSELNARQQQEYVNTGVIKFVGDPERGTQTWTRDQVLFNSRRNNDAIPDNVANLADNTDQFPTAENTGTAQELAMLQQQIKFSLGMTQARNKLEADQQAWDEEFGETHNTDGSPKDPDGQQLGPDDSVEGANGARPRRNIPGDPYNFTGARASVSALLQQQEVLNKNLAQSQADWESQYGETHNKNGVAMITFPEPVGSGRGDGQAELDARRRQAQAQANADAGSDDADDAANASTPDVVADPSQTPEPNDPANEPDDGDIPPVASQDQTPPPNDPANEPNDGIGPQVGSGRGDGQAEVDARAKIVAPVVITMDPSDTRSMEHVAANTRIRIANGDMDPAAVEGMMANLEQTYPGITDRIFPDGIDSYVQDPREAVNKLQTETSEEYVATDVNRNGTPPTGSEVEYEGETYRWLGVEGGVGGMWAKVNADGSRGTTGHQNHNELNSTWQDSTVDTEASGELISRPDITSSNASGELGATDTAQTGSNQTGSDASGDPSDTSTTDFTPSSDASGDPSDTGTTGSGGTDATDADSEVKEPEAEPQVFDPTAETPIDGQFADVDVPQSVKDEYADVLATQNGIKIMKFLDSLPPKQASSLRFNTPRPGQDGDADDATIATKTTSSRPDALDLPGTSRPDVVADPSQTPAANDPANEPDDGDIPPVASQDQTPEPNDPANEPDDGIGPQVGSGRGDGQTEVDARRRQAELFKQAQQRIRDAEAGSDDANDAAIASTPVGSGRGDGQAELDARRQEVQRRIRDAETASTPVADPSQTPPANDPANEPDDGSIPPVADPSQTPPPNDPANEPDDGIGPQIGSGRGDGQAEVDARQAQMQADAKARQAELFRQAQQRIRDAEVASQNATRVAPRPTSDPSQTPPPNDPANEPDDGIGPQVGSGRGDGQADLDALDAKTTDAELAKKAELAKLAPKDDNGYVNTTDIPTVLPLNPQQQKNQSVDSQIKQADQQKDQQTKKSKRNPRVGFAGLGKGNKQPASANQMRFTPINIRDPLNWKRFQ